MERSIRIGKDFNVRWSIRKVVDGERQPYELAGKELVLQYRTPYGLKEATEWKVVGNTIVWTFRGKEQKALGSYELILTENGGKDGMVTVDTCRAFKLVAHSCEETEGSGSDIVIEDVVLESEVAFAALRGPQGEQGPAGPQGPQGERGPEGPQGPAGPSYNDTEIKDKLAELSAEVGRVSAEIYGENIVIIQHSIQYGSESLDIFQKLEKGQSYLFKSSVPCNIEYFTKDGSYAHFFDNQTEIEFICPSDYDESKSQYLVRVGSTNGTMTISSNAKGISSKVEEVSSSVEEISSNVEDLSSKVEENVTKIVMLESSIEQEFQEAVGIAKGKIEFSSVGQIRSIPFVATKGTKFSIVINSEDSWERIGCFYEDWNNTEFRIASNIEVGKVYDVIAQVDITAIEFFLMTASNPAIELNVETCKNLSYEIQDLKNSASRQETIKLVAGVDYTKNQGNVRDNGTIESTSSYWYSSPIVAKGGDIVHITKTYGNGVNAICESNAEGSYHRPLLKYTDGVNEYRYPIERDCYITLGHQNVNTEVLFSAEILRGGEQGVKIASEGYTLNSLQLQDKTADTSFLSLSKDLDYEVTDKANIRKALLDREVMLYEVKNCTDDDILAQGICGYDDRSGKRIDGTITWKIYKNGILYISGYGKTYDYIKGVMEGLSKSEVEAYQQEQPTMWYYGFVKEGVQYTYSDTGFSATYSARVYDETTGEQMDESNGMHKGYSAPFYKYRSEIDFDEYTTHAIYDSHNPQGIKYNRICFDEDLSKGGITSLGDWFLYRCCVDSIVLPSQLTSLRRWSVRYSPTVKTVVMGDLVTFVEEYGLSRMESMETLLISPNIERVDYSALIQNANLRHLELPNATYIEKWGLTNNTMLERLDISKLTYLRMATLGQTPSLQRIKLSDSLNTIEADNFYQSSVQELIIPEGVVTIVNSAFVGSTRLQKVKILSNTISSTIWNNDSHLFTNATRYEIPVGNDISEFIYGTLKYMGVEDGFHIFIKL